MPVGIGIAPSGLDQIRQAPGISTQANASVGPAAASGPASKDVSVTGGSSRGDLNSNQGPATITVANSTDLNALAEAVTLASLGEHISITGSQFTRPPGQGGINIDQGTVQDRLLRLNQSTLSADVIKARSLGSAGRDAILIEGSTLNAAQLIRLYADGDSTLRFRGNVSLNTPLAELAGRRVSIDAGGRVAVSGNARIFTDVADFGKPGRGVLEAGGTKEVLPHASRPGRF